MTSPPGNSYPNPPEPSLGAGPSGRLWGTAHLTVALLLAAALVWCASRPPGQTYDIRPLPVPVPGWVFWACGLAFLASSAGLHFRLGRALRKGFAPGRGEILTWGLANVLVAVAAVRSVGLHAESQTHAMGVEDLNATLCTAAGLSALSLAVMSLRRPTAARDGNRDLVAGKAALVVHWALAAATAGGLLYLEQTLLAALRG